MVAHSVKAEVTGSRANSESIITVSRELLPTELKTQFRAKFEHFLLSKERSMNQLSIADVYPLRCKSRFHLPDRRRGVGNAVRSGQALIRYDFRGHAVLADLRLC